VKTLTILLAATITGFFSGIVGALAVLSCAKPPAVFRAHRFELLNNKGEVISFWGQDPDNYVLLAFQAPAAPTDRTRSQSSEGQSRGSDAFVRRTLIGVTGNGNPLLKLTSADGQPRLTAYVNEHGKPVLFMADKHAIRLVLGVEQSDTPGPDDNTWVLDFRPERARLGMSAETIEGKQYIRGFSSVHTDRVVFPELEP